jgi:hypothetical protein
MTTYDNDKSMLFNFLSSCDYNKNSNDLEFDNGYNLGDYSHSKKEFYQLASELSQLLRARLRGVFDENGNIISANPKDEWENLKQQK